MKVRITDGTYSFNAQVCGKVFEAEKLYSPNSRGEVSGYRVFIHFPHGLDNNEYPERAWTYPAAYVEVVSDDTPLSSMSPLPVFAVGDKVVLRHDSKFVNTGPENWNPVGVHGEVTGIEFNDYKVQWSTGYRNNYDAEDLALVKPNTNVKRKKNAPSGKRKQTIVYVVYNDGTDYEIRRAKGVVINQEHKSVNVNTDSVAKGGLVIRHNTSIPFAAIESVRVSTPNGDTCYYFKNGAVYMTAKEHTAATPFKTQTH